MHFPTPQHIENKLKVIDYTCVVEKIGVDAAVDGS